MKASELQPSSGGGAIASGLVLVLILLPVLYVASLGPAVWLVDRNVLSAGEGSPVVVFYSPLQYLADHSPAIESSLGWYASLFRSNQPTYGVQ